MHGRIPESAHFEAVTAGVYRLGASIEDDYPAIAWDRSPEVADHFLAFDTLLRSGDPDPECALQSVQLVTRRGSHRPFDAIALTPGFAVSDRARAVISELAVPGLRFAQLLLNAQPFHVLYSTRCIDALDHERSEVECFRTGPSRVKRILRYVFKPGFISVLDVFRLPELSDGMCAYAAPLFVTDGIVTAIQSSRLVGFRCEPLG